MASAGQFRRVDDEPELGDSHLMELSDRTLPEA